MGDGNWFGNGTLVGECYCICYKQFENSNREIEELKSANKAIADRCNELEKEKNEAVNKLGEVISKDLFLQAIAAVNGKILK